MCYSYFTETNNHRKTRAMNTQQNYLEEVNKGLSLAGLSSKVIGSKQGYIERRYRNNYPLSATVEIVIRTSAEPTTSEHSGFDNGSQ